MIRIAICDDDLQEIERAQSLLTRYKQEHPHYEITVVSFSAPFELLSYVEENGGVEIFLLDVYMDGMLGTEVARELRQLDEMGEIIFLTTSRDHAMDAFEVNAAQYLTKPYTESTLFSALDRVLKRLKVERRHIITLKTSEGIVRLFSRDVVFTESGRNNYQILHTIKGEKNEVRMTLGFKQNVPMTLTYVPMTYEERMLYDATKNEETNFRKTVAVLVSNGFDSDVFVSNNGHGA